MTSSIDEKPKPNIEHISPTSAEIATEQLAKLKDAFPECFTEGKVDFEKLRASLGDEVDARPERYSFSWAGKRDAIRLLQIPSRATLIPCPEESLNFDATANVFVEGENLEVLKLLYKSYFGRVNLIYIDPPYNTGNDFVYPDNFADPLDFYLRTSGQKDTQGTLLTSNPNTSGRYHSSWLSMMYPRLFFARHLLSREGIIFVSIDDNEIANLRMLMNELFGEENFVAHIAWKNVYGGGAKSKHVVSQHEYVLMYARHKDILGELELPPNPEARKRYSEKDDKYAVRGPYFTQPLATTSMDPRPNLRFPIVWHGEEIWPEKQWQWSKKRVEQALANDELVIRKENGKWSVRYKQYLRDETGRERGAKLFSLLTGPWTQEGSEEIEALFGDAKIFPFPKPSRLIKHLISCAWQEPNMLVLDFFCGSCPTAQAVLELNREFPARRRFIMVQLPEPTPEDSSARKAGYGTIAAIGKERIRRVIAKMKAADQEELPFNAANNSDDLGFRVFKLTESNYKSWGGVEEKDPAAYAKKMALFTDTLVDGWKPENVVWEIAIKEGYGLNTQIEREEVGKNAFYRVIEPDLKQRLWACLDEKLEAATLKSLELHTDDLFVCRDGALDDTAAANLALQCRLKTV